MSWRQLPIASKPFSLGEQRWHSDGGVLLPVGAAAFDPADAEVYYFGIVPGAAPSTVDGTYQGRSPVTGTITRAYVRWVSDAPSAENISIYLRVTTTDTLIETIGDVEAWKEFENNSLGVTINATNVYQIKIVCPDPHWDTNPTGVVLGGWLYVVAA